MRKREEERKEARDRDGDRDRQTKRTDRLSDFIFIPLAKWS